MATLRADRRLYVTADRSDVVEEGDVRGAYLLVAPGRNIGESDVAKYRLSVKGGKVVVPEAKQAPAPENKMAAPPEDKSADEPDEVEELPEWELTSSPAEYLEKYPTGPNAELAQRHVDAARTD